jgi:hypothetical protein
MPLSARNVKRIARLIGPPDERGCTIWHGKVDEDGYPVMPIGRRRRTVTRLWFELHSGKLPKGGTCTTSASGHGAWPSTTWHH